MNNQSIKEFASYLKAHGKQTATVESYSRDASKFESYLENEGLKTKDVNVQILEDFCEHLRGIGESPNSIRRSIIGVRQYFRFLSLLNRKFNSVLDESIIPTRLEKACVNLGYEDIEKILDSLDKNSEILKSSRDSFLICLIAFEGIKVSELIQLDWSDFLLSKDSLHLKISSERKRIIKCSEETFIYGKRYYECFREKILKNSQENSKAKFKAQKLLIGFHGRDTSIPTPKLTRHGVKFILYEIGSKIGLDGLNSEALRDFSITFQLKSGKKSAEIMEHLGLRRLGIISRHLAKIKSMGATPPKVQNENISG